MAVTVTVEDEATPLLRRMSGNADGARSGMVRRLAEALQEHVKAAAPVGHHFGPDGSPRPGGFLRDSLFFQVGPGGATLLGPAYGRIVITGARPHPIVAVRARALRFWWEREGVMFSGPRVRHPGAPPNDFRRRALARAFDDGTVERAASEFWQGLMDGGA